MRTNKEIIKAFQESYEWQEITPARDKKAKVFEKEYWEGPFKIGMYTFVIFLNKENEFGLFYRKICRNDYPIELTDEVKEMVGK